MASSPSWSRVGQWDGVAASSHGPSFPWDHFPVGRRDLGRSRAWLALPSGLLWGGSPTLQPPCCGFREGYQAESTAGSMNSTPLGRGDRDGGPCRSSLGRERGWPFSPPKKSHSCPSPDYRGAEAGEQSTPAYLGHGCERLNELPH